MADDEADRARRRRARERRGRITIVRARPDEIAAEPPIRGLEGMQLAARLTRTAWALGGQPLPRYTRHEIPFAFIPNEARR